LIGFGGARGIVEDETPLGRDDEIPPPPPPPKADIKAALPDLASPSPPGKLRLVIPPRKAGRGPGGPFEGRVEEGEDATSSSVGGFRLEMEERKARFGRGGTSDEEVVVPLAVGGAGLRSAAMRARRGSTSVDVDGLESSPPAIDGELGFRRAAMRARRGSTSTGDGDAGEGSSS